MPGSNSVCPGAGRVGGTQNSGKRRAKRTSDAPNASHRRFVFLEVPVARIWLFRSAFGSAFSIVLGASTAPLARRQHGANLGLKKTSLGRPWPAKTPPKWAPTWALRINFLEAQVGLHFFGRGVWVALGRHRAFFWRPKKHPKNLPKMGSLKHTF